MTAVVIIRRFLFIGLLTPSIRSAITIWQSTGHVRLKIIIIKKIKKRIFVVVV